MLYKGLSGLAMARAHCHQGSTPRPHFGPFGGLHCAPPTQPFGSWRVQAAFRSIGRAITGISWWRRP